MRRRTAFLMLVFAAVCAQLGASLAQQAAPALNYEFFETQVQPIFLATRPGHTRCVSCHTEATRNPRLQPLAPGATSWNEEQSRQNFEVIQRLVVPGSLRTSRLLLIPAQESTRRDNQSIHRDQESMNPWATTRQITDVRRPDLVRPWTEEGDEPGRGRLYRG